MYVLTSIRAESADTVGRVGEDEPAGEARMADEDDEEEMGGGEAAGATAWHGAGGASLSASTAHGGQNHVNADAAMCCRWFALRRISRQSLQ